MAVLGWWVALFMVDSGNERDLCLLMSHEATNVDLRTGFLEGLRQKTATEAGGKNRSVMPLVVLG